VEVVDRADSSDSADYYESLLAQAKKLLVDPPFACLVQGMQMDWLVVHDYGTGTIQVWPLMPEA